MLKKNTPYRARSLSVALIASLLLAYPIDLLAMKRSHGVDQTEPDTPTSRSIASVAPERHAKAPRIHFPLFDTTFKKVFLKPACMIHMLNSIFGYEGDQAITNIQYLSQEFTSDVPDGKYLIFDIHCTTATGETFLVEMQKDLIQGMAKRLELYSAIALKNQWDTYSSTLEGRQKLHYWKFSDLRPVRTLAFFNYSDPVFKEHTAQGRYSNDYQIQHTRTGSNDLPLQHWRFIDLHAIRRAIGSRGFSANYSDIQEANGFSELAMKWLYFLTRDENEEIPEELIAPSDSPLRIAFYSVSELSREENDLFTREKKALADYQALKEAAEEKARAEGKQRGIVQGIEQGRFDEKIKKYQANLSLMSRTGMSVDDFKSISDQLTPEQAQKFIVEHSPEETKD